MNPTDPTRHGRSETEAATSSGLDRGFSREDLLRRVEAELHGPLMAAAPHEFSEERRRRLLQAQEAICSEIERLRACRSADEIVLELQRRLESGDLAELDVNAQFFGFRPMTDLARELIEKARRGRVRPPP